MGSIHSQTSERDGVGTGRIRKASKVTYKQKDASDAISTSQIGPGNSKIGSKIVIAGLGNEEVSPDLISSLGTNVTVLVTHEDDLAKNVETVRTAMLNECKVGCTNILIGISFGGIIAQSVACSHPDLFTTNTWKLVLISSFCPSSILSPLVHTAFKVARLMRKSNEPFSAKRVIECVSGESSNLSNCLNSSLADEIKKTGKLMSATFILNQLSVILTAAKQNKRNVVFCKCISKNKLIAANTMILHGNGDLLAPVPKIKGASYALFNGVGHNLVWIKPKLVASHILKNI